MKTNFQPQLQQLVALTNGDKAAVQRLVNHAIKSHPGKSAQWYLDKVRHDLQRDRH